MTAAGQSEADKVRANSAITKFLDYYVDPDRTFDYAVMIDGPWGSGKTHLVKEFLKSRKSIKPLYVTLNGISSAEQIDQEFYRQLHPILSSPGMRLAGAVARAVAKGALKMDFSNGESGTLNVTTPEINLTKELANPRDRLLIFDDLERCKMPISEVLGYINGFVEHDGLKAVIIANEAEIKADTDKQYKLIKEKLIGQTLTVSAPAGEAFNAFIDQVRDQKTKEFLCHHKEVVLGLHAQGGKGNLRTLKHAMWGFEKISSNLEQRHWDKEEAVLKMMKVVMAVTIEYRAGELDENDLSSLIEGQIKRLMRQTVGSEKSKADLIEERYPQVDFNQVLLGASMLSAILLRGEMDAKKLVGAIDQSSDYMNPGEQPLWLRAMQFFNSDDAMCASIAEEVEAAFTNREFIVRGEFLHIVGLRLFFAKIGQISKSPGDVATESRAYIDDLARDDRLETSFDRPRDPSPENIYGAYAIIQSDTPEYRGIVEYYDQAAQKQQEKRYPEIARQLLAQLSVDPDGFFFELSPNAFRTGKYWHHPVLASLPPCEYARVVFDASPEIQSSAIKMLLSRHDGRRGVLLQAERPWVAQVKTELEKLILTAQPMTRHRLKNLIAQNLDPLLAADGAGKAVG